MTIIWSMTLRMTRGLWQRLFQLDARELLQEQPQGSMHQKESTFSAVTLNLSIGHRTLFKFTIRKVMFGAVEPQC